MSSVFGFALMVAYWTGISGAATTPRWMVGGFMCSISILFAPPSHLYRVRVATLILSAYLVLTLLWSEGQLDGVDTAVKMAIIAGAFQYGAGLEDTRGFIVGAVVGLTVSSVIAVAQALGWNGIDTYGTFGDELGRPAGLFYNGARLAEATAVVFAAALAFRLWRAVPLLLPALILPQPRGALLATIAGLMFLFWRHGNRATWYGLIAAPVLAAGFALAFHRGIDHSVFDRLALWHDTANALTFFGHGLGSYWGSFPQHAQWFNIAQSRPAHPHNEWLWFAYEGGLPSLCFGGWLGVFFWRSSLSPLKAVLVAIFVESLFAMPFHDPATVLFTAVIAGHLARGGRLHARASGARGNSLREGLAADARFHIHEGT